jgi:hypothetical protein
MEFVWLGSFFGLPGLTTPVGSVSPEGAVGAGMEVAVDGGEVVEGMVPVGMLVTGEWCSEESLLRFGLDAEEAGMDMRARPTIWTDVVKIAREVREKEQGIPGPAG